MTGFSHETARQLAEQVSRVKRDRDMVVASIHWGGNWGYDIPDHHRDFARELIDSAGVDVVHGHSSHHPKGIEVYRDRPIIYGCGDFLNDYEGIEGHAGYRGDLALMYFPTFDSRDGRLASLCLTPMQIKQMRLNRVSDKDFDWLETRLNREGAKLGTRIARDEGGRFRLHWD